MLRRIFSIMRDLDTPGVCPYRAVYGKNIPQFGIRNSS